MSVRDKWVRRFSVDITAKHENGFTIYKITSVLFPIESPEAVTVISVWKRYNDVQQLHKSMKSLHSGLHLRGAFPNLARNSFFKRFSPEVIEERAKTIKTLLEFVAEHRLLFTSTDFVNFLQTGYPEPKSLGVIDTIRSSLHLPIEETPPLEYQSDEDRAPTQSPETQPPDIQDVSHIPIYEAADVEIRESPKSLSNSFESITSLESFDSDIFEDISKVSVESRPQLKKNILPDLINFDAPSCSKFEDYHTMPRSDTVSMTSESESSKVFSRSNAECKTRTEDSYVFEAGYMLNLAARCEDLNDYQRAFECYKSGIEKMLIGVQTDPDPQRRALIKEKTKKYLSYAEEIYNKHLSNAEIIAGPPARALVPPLSLLRRARSSLGEYRVVAALGPRVLRVLDHTGACYAMKVIQKIPNNLTEFDNYFEKSNETKQPILPTSIPYMVQLHAYIETNNLIFLILSYAPGVQLFDYINNYATSTPNTPAREVNLENVFSEPMKKDKQNNIQNVTEINEVNDVNENVENYDISVKELVSNSQKLLLNVDRALTDVPNIEEKKDRDEVDKIDKVERVTTPMVSTPRRLPAGALRRWAAAILTALESLHYCGVVCRDLNPSNILLSEGGEVTLTYFPGYELGVTLARRHALPPALRVYLAPEIRERADDHGPASDYWSYGAILYYLICGFVSTERVRDVYLASSLPYRERGYVTRIFLPFYLYVSCYFFVITFSAAVGPSRYVHEPHHTVPAGGTLRRGGLSAHSAAGARPGHAPVCGRPAPPLLQARGLGGRVPTLLHTHYYVATTRSTLLPV